MSYDLQQSLDVLKLVKKIIGLEINIQIDSGIFRHNIFDDEKLLDKSKDIIDILGNDDKPIDLDDIIDAFKEMQSQFDEMWENNLRGRSYRFEGFDYDKVTNMYKIFWGS